MSTFVTWYWRWLKEGHNLAIPKPTAVSTTPSPRSSSSGVQQPLANLSKLVAETVPVGMLSNLTSH